MQVRHFVNAESDMISRCEGIGQWPSLVVIKQRTNHHFTTRDGVPNVRAIMRWMISGFYFSAGVAHLLVPEKLLKITPSWVPYAHQVIVLTGVLEIAVSIALVNRLFRYSAGIAMALYAVCVWPANFKHAIDGVDLPYISSSWLYHGLRLALQPVIVWWALYSAEVTNWPWRRNEYDD
jgi:uncharacterized membrane protein